MKTWLHLLFIFVSFSASAQLSKTSPFLEKKNHLPQQFKASLDEAVLILNSSCIARGEDRGVEILKNSGFLVSGPSASAQAIKVVLNQLSQKEFEMIEASDCVLGIEANQIVYSDKTNLELNDPLYSSQKFLNHFQFKESHTLFQSQALDILKPVVVAVIDSGVDSDHPEFLGRFWRGGEGEIGYNFLEDSKNPEDDFGHGTHVAGLVASQFGNGIGGVGISAQAQVMVLKTQDRFGEGSIADLISAIRFAVDNGAEVINISLSIAFDSPGLRDAIDYALERNVVLAVSSGNNGVEITSTQFFAPAAYAPTRPGLVSVGSVDSKTNELSWFSNYSTQFVKIAAPGSHGEDRILSTYLDGGYKGLDGTSMSSPIVAASLAQVISYFKTHNIPWTPKTVEDVLLNSSSKNSNLNGKIKDQNQLNLYKTGRALFKRYQLSTTGGFDD